MEEHKTPKWRKVNKHWDVKVWVRRADQTLGLVRWKQAVPEWFPCLCNGGDEPCPICDCGLKDDFPCAWCRASTINDPVLEERGQERLYQQDAWLEHINTHKTTEQELQELAAYLQGREPAELLDVRVLGDVETYMTPTEAQVRRWAAEVYHYIEQEEDLDPELQSKWDRQLLAWAKDNLPPRDPDDDPDDDPDGGGMAVAA